MNKLFKLITNTMLFLFLLLILVLPLGSIGILKLDTPQNVLGTQNINEEEYIEEMRRLQIENRILRETIEALETTQSSTSTD